MVDPTIATKPLVSVIIIFFNAERFLGEAIESVFTQTYDNWELLLVDDGSTDSSTEIAFRYANENAGKVRYLQHEEHRNRGMSASRNLGIWNAKGKYIALLDSDDVWFPHKLEQQVAILESQPGAALVYGTSQYWASWTGNPEDIHRDLISEPGMEPNKLMKPPTLLTLLYPLGKAPPPCPSDLLFRREMALRVGGFEERFTGRYHLYEDQAFLAKVFLTETVAVSDQCWDKYRLHPDSCVSVVTRGGHYHAVRVFFLNWLEQYLHKQKVIDPEVWMALNKALYPYRHTVWLLIQTRIRNLLNGVKFQLRMIWMHFMKRIVSSQRMGSITARPNPVLVYERPAVGVTTLCWKFAGTKVVEVHVNAPDGPLFARTASEGKVSTGSWVEDGMAFYLQDVTDDLPLSADHTLGTVRVSVVTAVANTEARKGG